MKKYAVIPARYAATRFPGKLMQLLDDKPVILHVYDNTVATGLFDEVYVVTDSDIIFNAAAAHGARVIKSLKQHESGSDRIAEAITNMDVDVVVNVQGDEPFVQQKALAALLGAFEQDERTQVASLMHVLESNADINDPNSVKVVTANDGSALYFSRVAVPYKRSAENKTTYFKHIGVYAFRKQALLDFTALPPGILEMTEKLEQLRYLENGISIKMVLVDEPTIGIDTPEDLEKAKVYLARLKSKT